MNPQSPCSRIPFYRMVSICMALLACALLGGSTPNPTAAERRQADEWPEITPAEKALVKVEIDPAADIVILNNHRNGKILRQADDWVNVIDCHWRAKVLTVAGRRFSEIRIPGGKFSRVTNIKARTIKPDGTIVNLAADQIFEKSTVIAAGYKRSEWVFNFPAVEPGVIIEYQYLRHDDLLVFIDPFYFEGSGVTLRASVTQAIPDEMGYQILCSRCPQGVEPTVKPWRDGPAKGKKYSIEMTNLQGYADEILMPPRRDVSPHLEMVMQTWKGAFIEALGRQDRLFTDWDSVAKYAEFHYGVSAKEAQVALKAMVAGWVNGIEDPREKIKSIVRHVGNDFRYVPWESVVGRTRSAGTIIKDMSADNEEKAVLTIAALKTIGVQGLYALVSGRDSGSINPSFFGFSQFTHTVVALPGAEGGYEWIDPTVSYAPFGFIPWRDSGARALLIKDGKGQLVDLPARNELNRTSYQTRVTPGETGRVELAIETEYSREDAVDMRSELAPQGEKGRHDYLKGWLERRQPGATLASFNIENLDNLDEPLKISIIAAATGIATVTDEALFVKGCLLSCYDSNPVPRPDRRHPLIVDRGWNIQETVLILAPEGMTAAEMPPSTQMDSGVARISMKCTPAEEGGVRCQRLFIAPRKQWPPNIMEKVRRMYDEVVKADRTTVAFRRG